MSLVLKELITIAKKQLEDAGVKDAEIDAKELYCHLYDFTKTDLMMHWSDVIQDGQCEAYFDLVSVRANRVPLQHITGKQEFMGLTFKINQNVLIPRQDTETMVEDTIELIKKHTLRNLNYPTNLKEGSDLLDLCCGSGAIGISLAKHIPKLSVTCSDISEPALNIAKENAKLNSVKYVKFVKSDMFEAFDKGIGTKKFNIIISNPPYIEREVIDTLEPEVKDYEPRSALDGGVDGLDFYRIIADKAPIHLKKDGILIMEIGYDQKRTVIDLLENSGNFGDIVGLKDLTGKDRIVIAKLKAKSKNK